LIPFYHLKLKNVVEEDDIIKTMDFSWKMHQNKEPIDRYAVF